MITTAVAVPVQSVQVLGVKHMRQSTFASVVDVMLRYTAHNTQQKQSVSTVKATDNNTKQTFSQ